MVLDFYFRVAIGKWYSFGHSVVVCMVDQKWPLGLQPAWSTTHFA